MRRLAAPSTAGHAHDMIFITAKFAERDLPPHLMATPRIVNFQVDGTDWSELGELAVD